MLMTTVRNKFAIKANKVKLKEKKKTVHENNYGLWYEHFFKPKISQETNKHGGKLTYQDNSDFVVKEF